MYDVRKEVAETCYRFCFYITLPLEAEASLLVVFFPKFPRSELCSIIQSRSRLVVIVSCSRISIKRVEVRILFVYSAQVENLSSKGLKPVFSFIAGAG